MRKRIVSGAVLTVAAMSAMAAFTTVGCKEKGPAEKAGEKIDNAAAQGADAVATAGASVKDAVDK